MSRIFYRPVVLVFLFLNVAIASAQTTDLEAEFQNPPQQARPHTWWHWMNGNITKEGIDKDLEWMHSVGLGGLQNFNVSLNTPVLVDQPLNFLSDGWNDAFGHAVRKADALGLDFTIASSPGWSETGGPWVAAKDGMKKLVWSEMRISGGEAFAGQLPAPPTTTGPFQTVAFHNPLAGDGHAETPHYYADAKVLAFPVKTTPSAVPSAVDFSGQTVAIEALQDNDYETLIQLPKGEDGIASLTFTYLEATTVRSAKLFVPRARPPFREAPYLPVLQVEDNGAWRNVAELPLAEVPTTVSFAPVTGKRFRILMTKNVQPTDMLGDTAPGAMVIDIFAQQETDFVELGHWQLYEEAKVNHAEERAGFAVAADYYEIGASPSPVQLIQPEQVIDLTSKVASDGQLEWMAPAGTDWQVLRFGYSLTGKSNHPAAADATGLEVDKYDADAVRRYLQHYIGLYQTAAGEEYVGKQGVSAILTDSIEVGASNWTANMLEQFEAYRGYDATPWLPVLTGTIIGTAQQSEQFLYDFRRTLADALRDNHYGTVADVAAEYGLKVYGEALENGRPVLGDDLDLRARTTVPMAALWNFSRGKQAQTTLLGDMKGAASVAHIYGQNLVAAESMTSAMSPWAFAPSDLKRLIDLEFVYGINRPVIHTSVHHPVDDKLPGLSLLVFGQYFNRHESWAELAKPWVDYMARSSVLLQAGRYYADVAYFYGEEAPLTSLFKQGTIEHLPQNYAYDFVNATVLKEVLSVQDGRLVADSGAQYRALYLGGSSSNMTLATLQRIAELVEQGATVIGRAPQASPALGDDPEQFKALVNTLWSGTQVTLHGEGRVYDADDVEAIFSAFGLPADFRISDAAAEAEVMFLHRKLEDGDAYFLTNRQNRAENFTAEFRVAGKVPEIWNAIDGSKRAVSFAVKDGVTRVPLSMGPEDAFFVVFREDTELKQAEVLVAETESVAEVVGPWAVSFQADRGAPASAELTELAPLNDSDVAGIRYFSGIVTYAAELEVDETAANADQLWLDLGDIGDVAEVIVNGQAAGITWFAPYRVDVSGLVHAGTNQLQVRVANLWVNRLIGDQQPEAEKITFVAAPTYLPDAPLRKSGLLGPVRLLVESKPNN